MPCECVARVKERTYVLPRCAPFVNVHPVRMCILSESAYSESASLESILWKCASRKCTSRKCILSESASPKSVSVPIMYRHNVRTILYYGIFALSSSAVMGIFRNGAILHVACTIGTGRLGVWVKYNSMARATSSIVETSSFSSRGFSEMRGIAWSGGGVYAGVGRPGGRFEWLPVEIFSLMGLTKVTSSGLHNNWHDRWI